MRDKDANIDPAVAPASDTSTVGLKYGDRLPVIWAPAAEPFDEAALARFNYDNLQVLQAVAALEEVSSNSDEDDSATSHALLRLDMKINLLLEMVGKLITERGNLPAPVPVQLGSDRLMWSDPALTLDVGDMGVAAVYLRASPATPLKLAGRIEAVGGENGGLMFELGYPDIDEPVRNALEKLIFRHHRRLIAGRHPRSA